VPIGPGEVIHRSELEKGIADLYRSRAFRSVEARLVPVQRGVSDVVYAVEETKSKRLDLEAGWGSWEMARGQVSYRDYNVFGTGRILRAALTGSVRHQGATLGLEDRWLLGDRDRLWIEGGVLRREEPFYSFRSVTAEAGVEHRFGRRHKVVGRYRFSATEPFDVAAVLPPADQARIAEFSRAAGIAVGGTYDTKDDRYLPTSGTLAEASVFWSAPELGATLEYVELEARANQWLRLGRGGVIALGAFAGTRQPYGGTDDLPIQERYFLGGAESVRSYGEDELTPVDPFGNGLGGLTAAEAHVEWRIQIVGILYGALFADVGVVSLEPFSLEGTFGSGLGAGLRVYTPVGPVRLDAAYNPGELHAATSRWQVHFSFGFSF
jgi:outer membrane protein insertion porin family